MPPINMPLDTYKAYEKFKAVGLPEPQAVALLDVLRASARWRSENPSQEQIRVLIENLRTSGFPEAQAVAIVEVARDVALAGNAHQESLVASRHAIEHEVAGFIDATADIGNSA